MIINDYVLALDLAEKEKKNDVYCIYYDTDKDIIEDLSNPAYKERFQFIDVKNVKDAKKLIVVLLVRNVG